MPSNACTCTAELEEVSAALKNILQKYLTEEGDYPLANPQVTLHRSQAFQAGHIHEPDRIP